MLGALLVLALAAAVLTAVAALAAAGAARQALRALESERRRERLTRLEAAVGEVHRAALAYARAMERARAGDAERAAERYGDACERLSTELSAGPAPGEAGSHLPVLLDASGPERVARSRAAELVLAELARLRAVESATPEAPAWRDALGAEVDRLRAWVRLARLGRLSPPGPPAAG